MVDGWRQNTTKVKILVNRYTEISLSLEILPVVLPRVTELFCKHVTHPPTRPVVSKRFDDDVVSFGLKIKRGNSWDKSSNPNVWRLRKILGSNCPIKFLFQGKWFIVTCRYAIYPMDSITLGGYFCYQRTFSCNNQYLVNGQFPGSISFTGDEDRMDKPFLRLVSSSNACVKCDSWSRRYRIFLENPIGPKDDFNQRERWDLVDRKWLRMPRGIQKKNLKNRVRFISVPRDLRMKKLNPKRNDKGNWFL